MSHYENIVKMMQGFGQETPTKQCIPPREVLLSRILMLQEEVDEFVTACGFFRNDKGGYVAMQDPDIVEMVDAMADIQVVNTGSAVACGVYLPSIVDLVDQNNLLKIATGHLDPLTGKFLKPKNHPKPDIFGELERQSKERSMQ